MTIFEKAPLLLPQNNQGTMLLTAAMYLKNEVFLILSASYKTRG